MCIHVYIYKYVQIYTRVHIYIHIYTYMIIFIYIYVHVVCIYVNLDHQKNVPQAKMAVFPYFMSQFSQNSVFRLQFTFMKLSF